MKKALILGLIGLLLNYSISAKNPEKEKMPKISKNIVFDRSVYKKFLLNHAAVRKGEIFNIVAFYDLDLDGKIDLLANYKIISVQMDSLGNPIPFTKNDANSVILYKTKNGKLIPKKGFFNEDGSEDGSLEKVLKFTKDGKPKFPTAQEEIEKPEQKEYPIMEEKSSYGIFRA